jgi:DEAD/DEAH box helicase domain-containing protein
MQPLIVAEETRRGIADFLTTTFPATTPGFDGVMSRFVDEPGNLVKGPYISLGLPFRRGSESAVPFEWLKGFRPHAHQARAFSRLSGDTMRSTVVATGTGSGKTEAFLYPVLEYCRRMRQEGRRGIKAIFVYPMNALATDQAGRVAREIVSRAELSKITAGLYVGDESSEQSTTVRQLSDGRYTIITDRDRIREEPPDILLTNYKMLDFLLMRARDTVLWRHNTPDTLRFLVVDELHAYDGAQGTDLACLIRRLKARLNTPPSTLVAVGTSATLGEKGSENLVSFAGDVFGESFDDGAIIGEERESVAEYLSDNAVEYMSWPSVLDVELMSPQEYASISEYLAAQHQLWFDTAVNERDVNTLPFQIELGRKLRQHVAFQNLLRDIDRLGGRAVSLDDLSQVVARRLRDSDKASPDFPRMWLSSLLALVAHASGETTKSTREPLLSVRVELWLRELRRMVATLAAQPALVHSDDVGISDTRLMYAPVHCRDCHVMGWGATQTATDGMILRPDLRTFYAAFFSEDTATRFVFPAEGDEPPDVKTFERKRACTACGALNHRESKDCAACGSTDLLLVDIARNLRDSTRNGAKFKKAHHNCPYCDGYRTLTIVGSQAASLASVSLGQLFGSHYNADKSVIAFSDSVQDAAHRAGFFEARNWRLNLRPAMAQVIHERLDANEALSLATLPQAFEMRWLGQLSERGYVKTFLPPSLSWLREYQQMLEDDRAPSEYVRKVTHRGISWAMLGEFGQDAHIGRTLPRTLTASVAFDADTVQRAVDDALTRLRERVDMLRDATAAETRVFLHGLLARMLRVGAIWHAELESYAARGCNIFAYRNNPAEFALLKSPRRPAYFSLLPYGGCESVTGDNATFYRDWARRAFATRLELGVDDTVFADIYRLALESLERCEITRPLNAERDGIVVWGIEPTACLLARGATQWRCERCRNSAIAEPLLDLSGTPCRRLGCRGVYAEHTGGDPAYYRNHYLRGDVRRILAHEHTGLLDRSTRERVEADFKSAKINVLSATPTLEMGIDIGDLSSVLLCAVPPAQANYTQRVGRAGRRTGNAYLPTLATGRPHDLYFWAQPREMLAGAIDAPGIFLNASAVLERQLTAFTLDCWVRELKEQAKIPHRLSDVLSAVRNSTQSKFPYPWITFVQQRQSAMLTEFERLFQDPSDRLSAETKEHLERFLLGSDEQAGMRYRVIDRLSKVNRDLDDLKRRRTRVENEIERLSALPALGETDAETLSELKLEKTALTRLMASVGSRDTFNFLTDEGLIPNYAFPEQGVLLHSVIVRDDRKVNDADRVLTFEYERPGASAITELAPNSVFYAEGRRVTIDQVDVVQDKPAEWRFCRSCSYAELESLARSTDACPRCGDAMWSDAGRVQKMMRLSKVYARTRESESRIGDDADDRDRRFFVRQALVDVDPAAIRQAWAIDDEALPFAFEFVSRIKFREVNFGEQDGSGQPIRIAGNDMPKPGFLLCSECGTVQRRRSATEGWKNHALYCSKRKQSESPSEECVFLYREFESEGIRAYLPESTLATSDRAVHSFIAALQMGLELKFRGSVDHLRIARDVTIAQENETPRQYLVIYDSVPGGTGYLKELMRDATPLFEVFQAALDRMTTCGCNSDETKDGCYRCVYTYQNSQGRRHVSRRTAVQLVTAILEHKDSLREIKTIGEIGPTNALFDSELERRFIEALRRRPADGSPRFELHDDIVHGKPGYTLRAGEMRWKIEPQLMLGPKEGVMVQCKPDFVLWPDYAPGCLPIAVFMDGWQYHKDSVGADIAKRFAIARSRKFSVWTLTSDDMTHVLEPGSPMPEQMWGAAFKSDGATAEATYQRFAVASHKAFHGLTAFEQLRARLLGMGDADVERVALVLALRVGAVPFEAQAFETMQKSAAFEAVQQSAVFAWPSAPEFGRCWVGAANGVQLGVQMRKADLALLPTRSVERSLQPCVVARWMADDNRPDAERRRGWQQWWHAQNVLFAMSNSWAAADVGTELGALAAAPAFATTTMPAEWTVASTEALSEVQPLLALLFSAGVAAPTVGYSLVGADKRIAAECELAWVDKGVAVTIGAPDAAWAVAGWNVYAHDAANLADQLVSALNG